MRDFKTTVLVCTPSYAMYIAESAAELGFDFGDLSLRVGLFGAEPWTNRSATSWRRRLGISATDNYGLSEVIGPGVSGECQKKDGLHVNEDHFIVEVVDPATGDAGARGQGGRAGLHLAHQGGPAGDPLPHGRPGEPQTPALRLRPHLRRGTPRSTRAPTT